MTFKKLQLDSGSWEYFIGKQNAVLKHPDGTKVTVPFTDLMDMTPSDIERGQDKRWFAVKPSDVRHYIETKVLAAK